MVRRIRGMGRASAMGLAALWAGWTAAYAGEGTTPHASVFPTGGSPDGSVAGATPGEDESTAVVVPRRREGLRGVDVPMRGVPPSTDASASDGGAESAPVGTTEAAPESTTAHEFAGGDAPPATPRDDPRKGEGRQVFSPLNNMDNPRLGEGDEKRLRNSLPWAVWRMRETVSSLRRMAADGRFEAPEGFFDYLDQLAAKSEPGEDAPFEPAVWIEREKLLNALNDTLSHIQNRLMTASHALDWYPRLTNTPLLNETVQKWKTWCNEAAKNIIPPRRGTPPPPDGAPGRENAEQRKRIREVDDLSIFRFELAVAADPLKNEWIEVARDPEAILFRTFLEEHELAARLDMERIESGVRHVTRMEGEAMDPAGGHVPGLLEDYPNARTALSTWTDFMGMLKVLHEFETRHAARAGHPLFRATAQRLHDLRPWVKKAVDHALRITGDIEERRRDYDACSKTIARFRDRVHLHIQVMDRHAEAEEARESLRQGVEADPSLSEAKAAQSLDGVLKRQQTLLDTLSKQLVGWPSPDDGKVADQPANYDELALDRDGAWFDAIAAEAEIKLWQEELREEVVARTAWTELRENAKEIVEDHPARKARVEQAVREANAALDAWRAFRMEMARRTLVRELMDVDILRMEARRDAAESADNAWGEGREDQLLERFHQAIEDVDAVGGGDA